MSGQLIEFAGNGKPYQGYLSSPNDPGPSVIVIQEWWGLVGHIKEVADRFAAAGFNALAPDFYHGRATAEPDEAGSLMMELQIDDASQVIRGAIDFLVEHSMTSSQTVGAVGFCMGGKLAMFAAGLDSRIGACVNFYGIHPNVHPNYEAMRAKLLGFFAEMDAYTNPQVVHELEAELKALGKDFEFHIFPGVDHAFFNSDRPIVYNAETSEICWTRMLEFFRANL